MKDFLSSFWWLCHPYVRQFFGLFVRDAHNNLICADNLEYAGNRLILIHNHQRISWTEVSNLIRDVF